MRGARFQSPTGESERLRVRTEGESVQVLSGAAGQPLEFPMPVID